MSDVTLYEACLRKILTNFRNRFYRNCNENPFERLPFKIVNVIMSAALDQISADKLRADDLEKLLSSKRIREFIYNIRDLTRDALVLNQILQILSPYCENLHSLNLLTDNPLFLHINWWTILRLGLPEVLQNLFSNTLDLENLDCCVYFNLKALKNCRKLQKLSLHFKPQEGWHEFLDSDDEGKFKTHGCLEYFNVCPKHVSQENVHNDEIMIILHYCPELVSLGLIESSVALSQFYGTSSLKLKLRHCYWKDMESPNNAPHLVRDAINVCPLIEDLELDNCYSRSLPFLTNLKNLVCLNITLDASVSSDDFNNALREIGPYLKHLSFKSSTLMDISLLLQNCYNLESLRLFGKESSEFAHTSVELPKLLRLTIDYTEEEGNEGRLFRLLRSCNHLKQLFLISVQLEDETFHDFLGSNSLSFLKGAYLNRSNLTENGFRELLQKAPLLEIVHIHVEDDSDEFVDNFRRVITETKRRVDLFSDSLFLREDFFEKRKELYQCSM